MAPLRTQWLLLGRALIGVSLAALVAAALSRDRGLLWMAVMAAAAALLERWRLSSVRALTFTELGPARLLEGESKLLPLQFRQPPRRCLAPVRLRLQAGGKNADEAEVHLSGVIGGGPAGEDRQSLVRVRGLRRGRVTRVFLAQQVSSFLGFVAHRQVATIPTDLWVLPHPRLLREAVLERMLELKPRGLERPQPRGPGEGDYYSARPWREGDAERLVHHKLSARRGRKILQVYRGEAPPFVDLAVDLSVSESRATFERADLDELLRFAAGIVRSLLQRQILLSLYLMGHQTQKVATPRCGDLFAFLQPLAVATPVMLSPQERRDARLPRGNPHGGRKVWIHLGEMSALPPRGWITIRVGSRSYYQLLENRFAPARR